MQLQVCKMFVTTAEAAVWMNLTVSTDFLLSTLVRLMWKRENDGVCFYVVEV